MQVFAMISQVENRIPDQLSGPMEGDVPSSLDFIDTYTPVLQLSSREGHTLRPRPPSQGDHRLMLDEQQKIVSDLTGLSPAAKGPLQLQDLSVRLTAEVIDEETRAHELILALTARRPSNAAITPQTPSRR